MESTKEQILLTAFRLFMQKGYKGVSMNMMVKETGLSKGAFYHYFENKEQLFVASLDNLFFSFEPFNQPNGAQLKENLWDNMKQYVDNIRTMIGKMQKSVEGQSFEMGYYRLMIDAFTYAPDFYNKIEKSNERELNYWKTILTKAKENKEIKPNVDVDLLAYQIQYVQDGVGLQSMFTGSLEELNLRIELILRQIYDLIKN